MRIDRKQENREQADRGDAPLIGIILLFGLVFAGAAVVAFTGMMAMDAIEDRAVGERNLQAMQQFDADISSLQYAGEDEGVPLEFDSGDTEIEEQGTLSFTINGNEACSTSMNVSTLVHEENGQELHYQAGGIFRPADGGSELLSSPEFDYRQETVGGQTIWMMNFPVVSVEAGEEVVVDGDTAARFNEEASAERQAKLQGDLCLTDDTLVRNVTITLEDNPHWDAWAHYFGELEDDHSEVEVDADPDERRVTVTAPLGPDEVSPEQFQFHDRILDEYGALVTNAEKVTLKHANVDGYDSTVGRYDADNPMRAKIVTHDGDVVIDNVDTSAHADRFESDLLVDGDLTVEQSDITADALVEDDFDIDHNSYVNGSVRYAGEAECQQPQCEPEDQVEKFGKWEGGLNESEPPTDVSDTIDETIDAIKAHKHNEDTSTLTDGTLESGGVYYFEGLDVSNGDKVTVDVTGGDVVVAIDGDVAVNGDIVVENDGNKDSEVRWFVSGEEIDIDQSGKWVVEKNDSSVQNWVIGDVEDGGVAIDGENENDADFVGVMYTPGSEIRFSNFATVKGGLVGEVYADAQHTSFHFDRALERFQTGSSVVDEGELGNVIDLDPGSISVDGESNVAALDWDISLIESEYILMDDSTHSFDIPNMPVETVDDFDGELEYWQRATGTADESVEGETETQEFDGVTEDDCWGWFTCYEETHTFDATAGEDVLITAEPDDAHLTLEYYQDGWFGGDWYTVESGTGHVQTELPDSDDDYRITVETDYETYYELEMTTGQIGEHYDEVAFEAGDPDVVAVEVDADGVDSSFEVIHDETGVVVAEGYGSDVAVDEFDATGGDHTIRVSAPSSEPFDYDVTLEKTRIEHVEVFQQLPITSTILFDGMEDVDAWPETDLAAASSTQPVNEEDVNHPANQYPKTYEATEVPADVGISIGAEYASSIFSCGQDPPSYAGTSRTYEGETYYEVACNDWSDVGYDEINALENPDDERIRILEDGDEVPDIEPVETQRGMQEMLDESEKLEDSLEEDGDTLRLDLAGNEFVALFETGGQSLIDNNCDDMGYWECALDEDRGAPPDFNNKVVFFEITDVHMATEDEITITPNPVRKGEEVDFTVSMTNVVDDPVDVGVAFEMDDEEDMGNDTTVVIEPGETESTTFTLGDSQTGGLGVGYHDWTIEVGDVTYSSASIREDGGDDVRLEVVARDADVEGEHEQWTAEESDSYSYAIDISAGVITVEDD